MSKPVLNEGMMCWFCSHFRFEAGGQGYSEYTPGWDASFACTKGHKGLSTYDVSSLKKAETCVDFDLSESIKKLIK